MNSKLKKKKGYSKKAITFWACMATLVLILLVASLWLKYSNIFVPKLFVLMLDS